MKFSLALPLVLALTLVGMLAGCDKKTCECVNCAGQTVQVTWPSDQSCAVGACDGISNNPACRDAFVPTQDAASDSPNPAPTDGM